MQFLLQTVYHLTMFQKLSRRIWTITLEQWVNPLYILTLYSLEYPLFLYHLLCTFILYVIQHLLAFLVLLPKSSNVKLSICVKNQLMIKLKNQFNHYEGFQGFDVFLNLTIIINKLVAIHNYVFFKPQASTIT
jgi:hypothetical protein